MEKAFATYHPLINFIFFGAVIIFGMFFTHPIFVLLSVVMSSLYYFLLKGKKGIKFFAGLLPVIVLISLINPLFNTLGERVLFTYFNGRPFTLEALLYGFATAGMFFSILLWFSCYNEIMTSDKFIFLFGKLAPAVSLILSMTLRLVPNFTKKTQTISGQRKCIGKSPEDGTKKEKISHGMDILSVLTSWALESAVITADSMKSRGYGSTKRTNFSIYKIVRRDIIVLIVMAISIAFLIFSISFGGTNIEYLPQIVIDLSSQYTIIGAIAYAVLLVIPSIIHIWESVIWHILKSRI